MEQHKLKRLGFALTIAAAATVVIAAALIVHRRSRRRRRNSLGRKNACYLATEVKPQSYFKRVLADNSYSSFNHLSLNERMLNSHPFEREIKALLQTPQTDFSIFNEIVMAYLSESYVWVESESQLRQLVDVLCKEKVFAVDTEQHSLRSFLGFTALVQVSTQKEDYLVDTIALHDVMDTLRPVFADPNILKVFHGADNDVLWLQRDFHIYVVNLFDTAKACEMLSKPQKSLAYLLKTYCAVNTNKSFQREDWRQRPLPEVMVEYARSDAHYLLYIARCLIEELGAKENDIYETNISAHLDHRNRLLPEVCRRSNTTCLQLYCKELEAFPGESVASSILSRSLASHGISSSKSCEAQFQSHIRRLCAWRDLMARVHDESLRYVLSDHSIIALADKRPSSEREIYNTIFEADQDQDSFASFNSLKSPSPLIRSHWGDVQLLLKDVQSNCDNILQILLQKSLGPKGSCALSIYNYNLLSKSNLKLANGTLSLRNGPKNGKFGRKASRELFVQKFSCKAPVYHNCRIYANDGRLLCYCDHRKLKWYVSRNLAKLVDDDPPAIMLLFEPKGRPEDEGNDFYIQSKRNMCVGCGESNHYLRYRIIPSCYRMHFPEHLKSHRSHDIVLVCVDCHEIAHAAAEKYKKQIAAEFGVPLFVKKMVDSSQTQLAESPKTDDYEEAGVSPLELRTAAMALLRHGPQMPSDRREELIEIVKAYYGGREITPNDLEAALLVGMSSRERRKFEKKKGAFYKQSVLSFFSDMVQQGTKENSSSHNGEYLAKTSKLDEQLDMEDKVSCQQLVNGYAIDVKNPSLSSELESRKDDPALETLAACGSCEVKDETDVENIGESRRNRSEEISDLNTRNADSRKGNSKSSLLGHGPHGEEVIDLLVKNYGDAGIQQFCQRWRQVFVDAVHPRYLPGGWDVKHSGRREFGDFSVYNPIKKAYDTTDS